MWNWLNCAIWIEWLAVCADVMISKIKRDAIIATQLHPLDPFMGTNTLSFALSVGSPDGTNITLSPLLYLYDPLMGQTSHCLLCYICRIPWWDKHHTLSLLYLYNPLMGQTSLCPLLYTYNNGGRESAKRFSKLSILQVCVCPVREYACVLWHVCATIIISSLLWGTSHEKFKGHA